MALADVDHRVPGGQPLLHFERVRSLVEAIESRNRIEGRKIRFVIASTLHDLTDEQLAFMRDHRFDLSTSLDGPEWLHNANRPRPERDSYQRTVEGIERGRKMLGEDAVSALTTLTRRSLEAPGEIIDEYRKLGFHSISLRPLSPYGFARKTESRNGYPIGDFLRFYEVALDHLLAVNRSGYFMEETYGRMLLGQLLTPFSHGYVDLRSRAGRALGGRLSTRTGRVYPSDEARMLASMGDRLVCPWPGSTRAVTALARIAGHAAHAWRQAWQRRCPHAPIAPTCRCVAPTPSTTRPAGRHHRAPAHQ